MASELQRVAQALIECLDQVPQIVEHLQRLAQRCRDNAGYIADISNHPAARNAALELDMAARCCDDAAHLLSLTPPEAKAWAMEMVGQSGGAATPSGAVSGRVAPGSGTTGGAIASSHGAAESGFTDAGVAAALERLPRREERPGYQEKTRGLWRDDQGRERELVSGVDQWSKRADNFAALRRLGRPPHRLRVTSHVEVKFAMMMRDRGLRDATIVINNEPCLGESGCDALLPEYLPAGASLTVYGPDGYKNTYRGKAEPR